MTDDHALGHHLDDFWDGDFTLALAPAVPASGPATALDDLGASAIRIGGRDLATLLAPAYRKLARPAD